LSFAEHRSSFGRNLKWDPDAETFMDDAEADAMLTRPVRKGYELPNV
jgi:hypothetical protein